MAARYKVTLTPNETETLELLTKKGRQECRTWKLARTLLLCNSPPDGPGWETKTICVALGISDRTVERVKKRFVEEGLDAALERKPLDVGRREIKFASDFEAKLTASARAEPPAGGARRTVRLPAGTVAELKPADSVSPATAHGALKKTNLDLAGKSAGKTRRKATPLSWRLWRTS
jgi:hypothetical protein